MQNHNEYSREARALTLLATYFVVGLVFGYSSPEPIGLLWKVFAVMIVAMFILSKDESNEQVVNQAFHILVGCLLFGFGVFLCGIFRWLF